MTNTTNRQDLCKRIERLIEEYIWTTREAAHAALNRAFATATAPSLKPSRTRPATTAPASSTRSRTEARRRADELGALSERLYESVCRTPGETMTVIGPAVGATARELSRPMLRLKQAGRIRSVGTRHATTDFPMTCAPQRSTQAAPATSRSNSDVVLRRLRW